ncbi:hypothetical protein NDU88_003205 [Pleurodeles waltl]|uniref:Uncharacterized protein n=1 Tax=Pleurodeles waltl TaxID=8319 RepID=A0AAV7W1G7_PLEWA|nr:hypothetical protein NDU88_003205 [Pleurodeles waltl]
MNSQPSKGGTESQLEQRHAFKIASEGGRGLGVIHDGRLRAELRTARATQRWRRRWRRSTGPLNAAGADIGVGDSERPASVTRGNALPGGAERSEGSRREAYGRPLSRGLKCGITPTRRDASLAEA